MCRSSLRYRNGRAQAVHVWFQASALHQGQHLQRFRPTRRSGAGAVQRARATGSDGGGEGVGVGGHL